MGVKNKDSTSVEATNNDIFQDIVSSNLRPVEKLFLLIEWFLRERKPIELLDDDLKRIRDTAEDFVGKKIAADLKRIALEEAKDIFNTVNEQQTFSALVALSYFSYVNDEYIYNDNTRKELLSKTTEISFDSSRIKSLSKKWEKIAGSPDDLFNRMLKG